jgi:hypothetical protein
MRCRKDRALFTGSKFSKELFYSDCYDFGRTASKINFVVVASRRQIAFHQLAVRFLFAGT